MLNPKIQYTIVLTSHLILSNIITILNKKYLALIMIKKLSRMTFLPLYSDNDCVPVLFFNNFYVPRARNF